MRVASGFNLVTAIIVLWNTVYLERATGRACCVFRFLRRRLSAVAVQLRLKTLNMLGHHRLGEPQNLRWSRKSAPTYLEHAARMRFGCDRSDFFRDD